MGFGEAVGRCYRGYASFRGRARRSEFWWFQLFAALAWIPTVVLTVLLWVMAFEGSLAPSEDPAINPDAVGWGSLTAAFGILLAFTLAVGVPLLAVTARRLHDIGQSAAWLLLLLAGLGVALLAMGVVDGQRGANRFGPDPERRSTVDAAV